MKLDSGKYLVIKHVALLLALVNEATLWNVLVVAIESKELDIDHDLSESGRIDVVVG